MLILRGLLQAHHTVTPDGIPGQRFPLTQNIFPLKHNQPSQQKTDAVHSAAASAV
jgi:hypothetical protein